VKNIIKMMNLPDDHDYFYQDSMFIRKLTQMVNKLKIETSISLRMRDEEVEIHGKSNCWDIGRR
jgi:hypothetical protein